MATVRKTVTVPGDNTHTVDDVREILNKCPWDAKVTTQRGPVGTDIIIWWDEEL